MTMSRRPTPTVGQRLFLGLLPSLLAVALVVGLAYWGEYGRAAPGVVVAAAAVLAIASLGATWANARYLAGRIARLAGTGEGVDELDRIERTVASLGGALSAAEADRARADRVAAARLRTHATMLSATVRSAVGQLDDVRLPLHILLDARFGTLSENQEELLASARDAAESMDGALRRLAEIADADRGALPIRREPVQVNDVVRAVLPLAHAAASRAGARLDVSLEPGLPRRPADRARLAEALVLLLESAAGAAGPDVPLTVTTTSERGAVRVSIAPRPRSGDEPETDATDQPGPVLARRLIEAQDGRVDDGIADRTIRLG